MAIRTAGLDDLDAIADLAQDQRIRQQGWEPAMWCLAPNAWELHRLFLRWTIAGGRATALVCDEDSALDGCGVSGYVIAAPLHVSKSAGPTWVIDEMAVASTSRWTTVGRALLAAVAARGQRQGIERIAVGCPSADVARRSAFTAAGLDLNCWFRMRRLDGGMSPGEFDGTTAGEPGFPLPHLHGLAALAASATSVTAPGAHALLSPSIAPPPVYRPGGPASLADPVIANDEAGLWAALDELETTSRRRGDVTLLVAVGPGEEPLDEVLDRRDYRRPLEWWTFRPRP